MGVLANFTLYPILTKETVMSYESLSPEAQAAFRQYSSNAGANTGANTGTSTGTYQHSLQDWELSSNGRQRAKEIVQRSGLTREQAQADPRVLMQVTLRALAEQRGQPEMNIGIDGRNGLGSSTKSECVGRSLSDMASLPGSDD